MLGLLLFLKALHLLRFESASLCAEDLLILGETDRGRAYRVGLAAVVAAGDGEFGRRPLHRQLLPFTAAVAQIGHHDALLVADARGKLLDLLALVVTDEVRAELTGDSQSDVRELQHLPDADGVTAKHRIFNLVVSPRLGDIVEMRQLVAASRRDHHLVATVAVRMGRRGGELGREGPPEDALGLTASADVGDEVKHHLLVVHLSLCHDALHEVDGGGLETRGLVQLLGCDDLLRENGEVVVAELEVLARVEVHCGVNG